MADLKITAAVRVCFHVYFRL